MWGSLFPRGICLPRLSTRSFELQAFRLYSARFGLAARQPEAAYVAPRCISPGQGVLMPLLIRNGQIVTASDSYRADIFCEGETISAIGANLRAPPGATVVDASGKLVFPGFIDPHVHIYLPFMGTYAKDTYETASKAALVGGTTTFIEMICPARGDKPLEAFELWLGKAQGNSACDFTFHMGVTRYDAEAEKDFREIVKRGISSFK